MEKQILEKLEQINSGNLTANDITSLVKLLKPYIIDGKKQGLDLTSVCIQMETLITRLIESGECKYSALLLNIITYSGLYETDAGQEFIEATIKELLTNYALKTLKHQLKDYNRTAMALIVNAKKGAFGKRFKEIDVATLASYYNYVKLQDDDGSVHRIRNYIKGNLIQKQLEDREQ